MLTIIYLCFAIPRNVIIACFNFSFVYQKTGSIWFEKQHHVDSYIQLYQKRTLDIWQYVLDVINK